MVINKWKLSEVMKFILFLLVLISFAERIDSQGTGVYLSNNNAFNAKCLDGSPPMYWITPGSGSGANKWFLSFEGGGACNGIYPEGGGYNNCYYFAYDYAGGYYGTSNAPYVSPIFDFNAYYGNYYSTNATLNPLMYNWNMVYMHYCDGGLWTGNISNPVPLSQYPGEVLSFRGGANAWAIFNDLLVNQGMNSASEVVVSGQSAGGIAAYNYIDLFAAALPVTTKVRGLMDSGFFLPLNYPGCNYKSQVDWIFQNMSSIDYLNPACLATQTNQPSNCMFAQNMVPVTQTPIFGIQSRFDSYQYGYILCNSTDMNLIYDYSVTLADTYFASGMNAGVNGGLLDDCPHHYYYYNFSVPDPHMFDPWNHIVANNGKGAVFFFSHELCLHIISVLPCML